MLRDSKTILITIIISGIAEVIIYLINFVLTRYVTNTLGIELYGFVSIAKNIVSYAGILTISLTSFAVRYISVSYHKNQIGESNAYFSSVIVACTALCAGIFAASFPLLINLEKLLIIPDESVVAVKILFIFVFITFFVTTITTPFSSSAYIANRLDLYGIWKIISYGVEALSLVILYLVFDPEIWFVGIGTLLSAIVILFGNNIISKKYTPQLKFNKKIASIKRIIEITRNGFWNSLNQLGNTLNSGLDLVISNLMLTGVETGEIAVAKTIGAMFSTLSVTVFQAFQPDLIKKYSNDSKEVFLKSLLRSMKICGGINNIAVAGFFSLGLLYYKLWLPTENWHAIYVYTIATVVLYITSGVVTPLYYVSTLTLKNKIPCIITIIGGVLNIGAMYLFLKYTNIGAIVVVLSTTIIMMAINLLFNPIYAAKCLGISSVPFYIVILKDIISAIIMGLIFVLIERLLNPGGWISLILLAILFSAIGIFVHLLVMDGPSKGIATIKGILQKLNKRNR